MVMFGAGRWRCEFAKQISLVIESIMVANITTPTLGNTGKTQTRSHATPKL